MYIYIYIEHTHTYAYRGIPQSRILSHYKHAEQVIPYRHTYRHPTDTREHLLAHTHTHSHTHTLSYTCSCYLNDRGW